MAGNFNIKDRDRDPLYSFHSFHSDFLMEIDNYFQLKLSFPVHQVSTCYTDNHNDSNSVIDLLFLWPNSVEINNYFILPDSQHPSDHTPLIVDISIIEEVIQEKRHTIIRNSKEEINFISELMNTIGSINTASIPDKESLETIVQDYVRISEFIWYKFSQCVNINKCSKAWWNEECWDKLTRYRFSKILDNWKVFKGVMKKTKYLFFNNKIQEIMSKNRRPWNFMNWVKKQIASYWRIAIQ